MSAIPQAYALAQNYPNPFNPFTTIRYDLPAESRVTLKVYTMLGQLVATLVEGNEPAGEQEVTWDASGWGSGVYIYRFEAASLAGTGKQFHQVGRMLLVK